MRAAELQASDGSESDNLGASASLSGNIGLVGAVQDDTFRGSAYVFRNLDTATGIKTQNVKLLASDGHSSQQFGFQASLFGSVGLVGSPGSRAVFLFRDLHTAVGSVTENAKLTASDGLANDNFGAAVSLWGNSGLVGNRDTGLVAGAAYLFRDLNIATGTITETAKLVASDAYPGDNFGAAVSLSDSLGVVGDFYADDLRGSAYVYRNLNTVTGTVTESAKLIASDRQDADDFGAALSLSGSTVVIGALAKDDFRGAAYVFRGLNTVTGTVTQNAKLVASDGAAGDDFAVSVAVSGGVGLVGARDNTVGANDSQGSAYLFRNLETATGTIAENVKITASDGMAFRYFGSSVSLDGDGFLIGALGGNGRVAFTGKAYSGSVSSVTTLDIGSTSRSIDGVSFSSSDDWIIGDTNDANMVNLGRADTAKVTIAGKAVYIGKNAGSDGNILRIGGILQTTEVYIGTPAGNQANTLQLDTTADFEAVAFRLAPDNLLKIEGNFTAVDSLLTYLGSTKLQVWNDGLWQTVDDGNHAELIGSSFTAGYTEILPVPEPSAVVQILGCLGAAVIIRRRRDGTVRSLGPRRKMRRREMARSLSAAFSDASPCWTCVERVRRTPELRG